MTQLQTAETFSFASATLPSVQLSGSVVDLRARFRDNSCAAESLFSAYYKEYESAFPDPAERPNEARCLERLNDPNSPLRVYAFVSGQSILGGRHVKFLSSSTTDFAVGEHTWVSPEFRKFGCGGKIVKHVENILHLEGAQFFIGEFNDPLIMRSAEIELDSKSGITPEGRLIFWKKQGYFQVDAPYIQPPLYGRNEYVDSLTLGIKFLEDGGTSRNIPVDLYREILKTYFSTFSSAPAIERTLEMINQQLGDKSVLEIISLTEPRRLAQVRLSS